MVQEIHSSVLKSGSLNEDLGRRGSNRPLMVDFIRLTMWRTNHSLLPCNISLPSARPRALIEAVDFSRRLYFAAQGTYQMLANNRLEQPVVWRGSKRNEEHSSEGKRSTHMGRSPAQAKPQGYIVHGRMRRKWVHTLYITDNFKQGWHKWHML